MNGRTWHAAPDPASAHVPKQQGRLREVLMLGGLCATALLASPAFGAITCERQITANVVAFDKPLMYNRLGAANINGTMYALKRDVINTSSLLPLSAGGAATPGQLDLRPDKRHRPLVLRVRVGDCLTVNLTNLLTAAANPRNPDVVSPVPSVKAANFTVPLDEQTAERRVGFHAAGVQYVNTTTGLPDDGANVGTNGSSLAAPGVTKSYKLYASKEGVFVVSNPASTFGSDGNMGNNSNGLFGQLIVEPRGAKIYRSQVFEEELRLATAKNRNGTLRLTALGQPILDYEAAYPKGEPWASEGKTALPVLNMMNCASATACEIVHSEINAVIAGPCTGVDATTGCNGVGHFPNSTYPLESVGKRNPTVPNRLEPFRDFASVFHDETANGQAFPGFYIQDPVFRYVLAGVKDAFMINYGSGGIGSEIIANRLGVGPMHDCLDCAYEEFFLTSFTVGDPALVTDVPANLGLENLLPGQAPPAGTTGPKAHFVIGAEDPSNVHHSYTGDFVKFRNTHNGKEQHVFHLHNHQWLFNPNDDNSNYLDAQGIGPGVGYTYEINFGGSGNRNKSSGDAIFHCHFYPHFAQGMWYHWRHNDTFQAGTILTATPNKKDAQGYALATGFHSNRWDLGNTTPTAGARAYPDGEIAAGTPIPALVPLPGKPMPVIPGRATVVAKTAPNPLAGQPPIVVGSNAKVIDRTVNPGFPFWVAGIEDVMGQRPPTPPLDMLTKDQATTLKNSGNALFAKINPEQADGWDGGLPRHSLQGYSAGGATAENVVSPIDFSKVVGKAKPVFYPEEGTALEQVAMAFHGQRCHDTFKPDGTAASCAVDPNRTVTTTTKTIGGYITNGSGGPVVGAPFHNPCIDDTGTPLSDGILGKFFSGESATGNPMSTRGRSVFNSDTPRIYKATNLQFDAVLNKVGYHNPQQRIVALWQDVGPVIAKNKPPEPLVFRSNTFDCTVLHHSNLVPEAYEIDDYQVRTPTDIIGQHIHLPKWDLTTTDGAANGWNYEDGTLSPGAVRERIDAINCFNGYADACKTGVTPGAVTGAPRLAAQPHPYFASVAAALEGNTVGALAARETVGEAWLGARTTTQRWFIDPVVNTDGIDRGLGIVFTHDHYGPSTHQQIGLYSTLLAEPAASQWVHNEFGTGLGCTATVNPTKPNGTTAVNTTPCRWDGGPTSWQAAILPQPQTLGQTVGAGAIEPYREFYFEYSDFQHAYEAGVYVGTNQMGLPLLGTGPGLNAVAGNEGNNLFAGVGNAVDQAFRFAINPPARLQINPVFPDLYAEIANTAGAAGLNNFCPTRPCPQAIDVQDPGVLVVNYRHEPIGLRIYDPTKVGPDGKPGMQADGQRGDLAFALQSRTDRAIPELNVQPTAATVINGTHFPPPINAGGVKAGDPFTPMVRTYTGDTIRVKMQAGGHEEEHNASIHGMKWLQAGSGHGKAPNSGWRSAQAGGISEQFTLAIPVTPGARNGGAIDYAYSMDGGNDGWWSGMWGILRSYNTGNQPSLFPLPTTLAPIQIANATDFSNGLCPSAAPIRSYDITAVLANSALPNALGVTIPTAGDVATKQVGAALNPNGGTLVYNHRKTQVGGQVIPADGGGVITLPTHVGPLNDPTAILFVRTSDLDANGKLLPTAPVEPVVIRAAAGECVQVTLRNKLPALASVNIGTAAAPVIVQNSTTPDLATYSMIQGVVKRDRFGAQGSTTFNINLFRPSSWVGMTPGLLAFDVDNDGGLVVGENPAGQAVVNPGGQKTYFWYAGDVSASKSAGQYTLTATPVEFGGSNILPADRVKQGAKSLVGAAVVEPTGATWSETTQAFDHQDGVGSRLTRAQATVTAGGQSFRSFSLVLTKGQTQYYGDGTPVEHMNGEAVGIPEDSQEASGMALNYGIEPAWFRFGLVPQAPFGNVAGGYGGVINAGDFYSNNLLIGGAVAGDPVTPVFLATAGQPFRMHLTNPFGTTRGSTFTLHGHVWQRDPYVCPGESRNALTGACNMAGVGSKAIGNNPMGFAQGGQESWNAPSHFDVVSTAGGANAVKGDFLFRDHASFGNASGVWGLLRAQ